MYKLKPIPSCPISAVPDEESFSIILLGPPWTLEGFYDENVYFLMQNEPLLISQGEVSCSGMRCVLLLWSS